MATTPLTLYLPIKQDATTQATAVALQKAFAQTVKAGLDASHILHYGCMSLIPNANGQGALAMLLVTTFDGAMNPYLEVFWKNGSVKDAFLGLISISLNPPTYPVNDLNGFERFINANNLNPNPADLYCGYPQTVKQIQHAFPPAQ